MRLIQKSILEFIEKETISCEDFQDLISILNQQKITKNIEDLREILQLLVKISRNHHRGLDFFKRIEQVILYYQKEIHENFSNYEIFDLFRSSKRLLLFLFEEKIIMPNKTIASIISNDKYLQYFYPHYFYPEMSLFFNKQMRIEIEKINQTNNISFDDFQKFRKIGENESYICQLIQKDSCIEFISFVNKKNIPISTFSIKPSIFETNSFLMKNEPTLIEYSAFYGSIQIFRYLFFQKVELTPSLWIYAIHSKNAELIHFLEENHVNPPDESFLKCLIESLKCHHIDFSFYIKNNLIQHSFNKNDKNSIFFKCLQYHNYKFCHHDFAIDNDSLYYFCKNGYTRIVEFLVNSNKLNINSSYSKGILNHIIFLMIMKKMLCMLLLKMETKKLLNYYYR